MALFHALWKNNMQILVKKLRENPKFWEYITSPLFAPIRPGLRIYSQIFNVLGIELFAARGRPEPALGAVLERFFDPHRRHLDDWVEFAFSFRGRGAAEEAVDEAPAWLGLLASWKDFATIVRRSPPVELNIAHKSKIAAPCLTALGAELEGPADARPVALLAELYVALLAAWRDDCFEDRRRTARQLGRLLTAAHAAYEGLPPRAARALLALAAAAVGALDYEIRADAALARRVVAAVADINGLELARALDEGAPGPPEPPGAEPSTAVLALALLERALDLPEEGGALGPETGRLVDDLLRWLRRALGRRERAGPALAALRCLAAGARGPLADELLHADVEGALWLRLARPAGAGWAAGEWARVLGAGLEVAGALVAAGGARFAGAAVALVAMQADQLADALAAPDAAAEALALRASALALVLRLLRFEALWRMQNVNSLIVIMRSVSVCLCHSVGLCMRARRDPSPAAAPSGASPPPPLQCGVRLLRLAAATLARLSPPLLALLAPERAEGARFPPLLELHFGAPKLAPEPQPRLCCGTLLAAICLLTRILAHVSSLFFFIQPKLVYRETFSHKARQRSFELPL
ncbi:unnamed protein product [Diatraea saccharalis]|uniref:Uncharacterized protein n=1 Tax=Diatraea saccharalis TaxID=40085 RepID=A0A9N9RH87_9NEOP|nr:unnamed protein product [Diatraea saccharalis]